MNVTVYMASNYGNNSNFRIKANELGRWLGKNGHSLVYGGGSVGLMGEVARSVLENGGDVIGITPMFFVEAGVILEECTQLEIVPDVSARRSRMIEIGEAYIALPGGIGTLDEITECMTLKGLGLLGDIDKPIIVYNVDGHYDNFISMMEVMVTTDLYKKEDWEKVHICYTIEDVVAALDNAGKIDYTRNKTYFK